MPHEVKEGITIGRYELYRIEGYDSIFIELNDGGGDGGAEFNVDKLEEMIDNFYKENF